MQHYLYVSLLCFQLLLFHCHSTPFLGANLTSNVDRIKIVFTPMVCRRICHGGQCYNNCERGDKTTVYSENQGLPSKSHGFRLCKSFIVSQFVHFSFLFKIGSELIQNFSREHALSVTNKVFLFLFFEMHWNETFFFVKIPFSYLRVKEMEKIGSVIAHWDIRVFLEMGNPHSHPTLPPSYPLLVCSLHLALNLTLIISYAQQ